MVKRKVIAPITQLVISLIDEDISKELQQTQVNKVILTQRQADREYLSPLNASLLKNLYSPPGVGTQYEDCPCPRKCPGSEPLCCECGGAAAQEVEGFVYDKMTMTVGFWEKGKEIQNLTRVSLHGDLEIVWVPKSNDYDSLVFNGIKTVDKPLDDINKPLKSINKPLKAGVNYAYKKEV